MSRNFELLAQLETESDAKADRHLPLIHRVAAYDNTPSSGTDSYREEVLRLVQRAFLSGNGTAPRQVVFCGVDGRNGSTSVCASAARALAASVSKPVCAVDANLRSPGLSDLLGVGDTIPIFGERTSMRDGCVQIGNNLWFGGPEVVTERNGALAPMDQLKERLARMRGIFEFVLIDAPGTNICEDAPKLGQLADAAILVIDANLTRRLTARKALQTLEASGVKLLGTVLHNRTFPIPEKLYSKL